MLKGKTASGFKFEIDEARANDMELLEAMVEADDNRAKFPKVVTMLLGEDEKRRLYDHTRKEDGTVPIEETIKEFIEIMTVAGSQTKNS